MSDFQAERRVARMSKPEDLELGARLRVLRLRAGFSQEQVAAALGIPRSAVTLLEAGERALSSSELARLSQIYGWSPDYLLFGEPEDVGDAEPAGQIVRYFRRAGAIAAADERWLTEAEGVWRRYADLETKVWGGPKWEVPTYPVPSGRPWQQGERLAEQERRRLGLGVAPVRSMIDLLEGEGVKVLFMTLDEGVAGCYFFSEQLGPCVVVNYSDLPARRRFTEGHEYCHFLVDRVAIEGEICAVNRRSEHFEMRANAFAAAFLLPAGGIEEALEEADVHPGEIEPEVVVHLMYRFGVSYQAILWRLVNLRQISRRERDELAKTSPERLAEKLGYDLEPGRSESSPDRFRRLALDAWRAGEIKGPELAELMELPVSDIRKVFGKRERPERRRRRSLVEEPDWL